MLLIIISAIILLLFALPLVFSLNSSDSSQLSRQAILNSTALLGLGILIIILLFISLKAITDFFWFESIGQTRRFLTVLGARILLFMTGSAIIALFFISLYLSIPKNTQISSKFMIGVLCIVALFFGFWPSSLWNEFLLYFNQVKSSVNDPLFGHSISLYLFSLPLYSDILKWCYAAVITGFVVVIASFLTNVTMQVVVNRRFFAAKITGQILFLSSLLSFLTAVHFFLKRYYLLYINRTILTGANFTDTHFTRYGYLIVSILFLIISILLFCAIFFQKRRKKILPFSGGIIDIKSLTILGIIIGISFVLLWSIPVFVQKLVVSPNEITLEKPYIKNNIDLTRNAYSITGKRITEKVYPLGKNITADVADKNRSTLNNVRIWDWRALLENLRQQQEIRLYYRFYDADIDRYLIDGKYTQVMLAVRELSQEELDPRSKNWISLRLKYTHGFGAVLLSAHDLLPQGKPNLLIRGIPPVSSIRSVKISEPRVYYGELTNDYVYVGTKEQEFDYPDAQKIEYNFYNGKGGVSVGTFITKLLYALRFDDYRLLISGYFTDSSKILFYRNIKERAFMLLPFLKFDSDPYPVITDDGRIVWILDAYTISERFPYSQPYRGFLEKYHNVNYIRNSVKVVIDAYDGSVEPYIVDSSDVIIASYKKMFPGLFKNFNEMGENIKKHIRYPVDFFTIQSEMYTAFHMTNPETFYQREDLWEYATERYRENFQPVNPYYVMVEFPNRDSVEFVLIVPFTPRNKNVMNAWMAGHCNTPYYGDLTVYPFSKGIEILGPRQIEARIDQNTIMSQFITLWGQRGSEVIRGNLLVIPLFYQDSLFMLYVEPVIISAEGAQLPEIKRIIVADQDQVLWAEQFDDAMELLTGRKVTGEMEFPGQYSPKESDLQNLQGLVKEFLTFLRNGNYSDAGSRLEEVRDLLEEPKSQE